MGIFTAVTALGNDHAAAKQVAFIEQRPITR
jgi:hypothetical protein